MRVLGRPAWEELADALAELIIAGELAAGERLVETAVAERFGISRGPVRTALAWLERQGLAESRDTGGMVVVSMTPADVYELFEVRIALECAALQRILDERVADLSPLSWSLGQIEQAARTMDIQGLAVVDLDFHRKLCEMSGNGRLLRNWDELSYQIRLIIATIANDDVASVEPLTFDHHEVFDAIASPRPGFEPVDLLRGHLSRSRDAMIQVALNRAMSSRVVQPEVGALSVETQP